MRYFCCMENTSKTFQMIHSRTFFNALFIKYPAFNRGAKLYFADNQIIKKMRFPVMSVFLPFIFPDTSPDNT